MENLLPDIEGHGLSITGPVREENQDSIRLPDRSQPAGDGLLYAIADGMGGYSHGGIASLLTLEAFSSTLGVQNGSIPKTLRRGVENANLAVFQKAQRLGVGRMGSTITAAYVLGNLLFLAHVGDSRAYLIRGGRAVCLTADHTTVGDMVRAKLISANKVRTHAQRSVLTKAIGISLFVQPDITQHRLQSGDRLVLCSDGVWSVIEDEEFAHITTASSVEVASDSLIKLALERETDDNASVIVFHLRRLVSASSSNQLTSKDRRWWQIFRNLAE